MRSQRAAGSPHQEGSERDASSINQPVGKRAENLACELQRQTRLAASAGARDRDHSMLVDEPRGRRQVVLASHEVVSRRGRFPVTGRASVSPDGRPRAREGSLGDLLLDQEPHLAHRCEALRGPWGQTSPQEEREPRGQRAAGAGVLERGLGIHPHRGRELLVHGVTWDEPASGQALVQQAAHGPHIRAGIDGLAAHLLGAHVARRTHHLAGSGRDIRPIARPGWIRTASPKSRTLTVPSSASSRRWLEISMNDTLRWAPRRACDLAHQEASRRPAARRCRDAPRATGRRSSLVRK